MSANEHGIGFWKGGQVCFKEVAYMDMDAWRAKLPGVLLDDGFALRTNLEGLYLQVWELQARLDADATCAEADIPEHMATGQLEGLQRQQADGHLGDHFFAPVEEREGSIGNAEWSWWHCATVFQDDAIRHGKITMDCLFRRKRRKVLFRWIA